MLGQKSHFRFTQNAFVDSGLTVLMLHAGVHEPDELTEAHITSFINWAVPIYLTSSMAGFLTFVIFPNASFANPAQINKEEYRPKREKILRDVFNLWRWTPDDPFPETEERASPIEQCVFSGDQAVVRISQTLMPMIGGRDAINFFPQGRPKLPVSGWCLLALLAMPMATLNSSGKAFLPFSYDAAVRRDLLQKNWERNRHDFLNQTLDKRPNYSFPKTQLIGDLLDIINHDTVRTPITAYHFVSGGQTPNIDLYPLSMNVLRFIKKVKNSRQTETAWNNIVSSAWERNTEEGSQRRNFVYEDMFTLPQRARRFLRRYLLRYRSKGKASKTDPRFQYSFIREREVISWELIRLFLEDIMRIDRERVDAIKALADRLVGYLKENPHFYRQLYMARGESNLRRLLLNAAHHAKEKNRPSLLPYDDVIKIFFVEEDGVLQSDWYLAIDLLLIAMIEQMSSDWVQEYGGDIEEAIEKTPIKEDE